MRFVLLCFLFMGSILTYGQEESPNEFKRFAVGLSYSPDYTYRTISASGEWDWLIDLRNRDESGRYGYTASLWVGAYVVDRLRLESGVQYFDRGFRYHDLPLIDIYGTELGVGNVVYHHYYIAVPLKISYDVISSQWRVYPTVGASLNFFSKDKVVMELTYNDGSSDESESTGYYFDVYPTSVSLIGGVGVAYNWNSGIQIRLEPVFRYDVTPLADAPVDQRHYSAGINCGVFYLFNFK